MDPIPLFTLDSSTDTVYPNVRFEVTAGNEGGIFQLTKDGLYKGKPRLLTATLQWMLVFIQFLRLNSAGSLELRRPIVGPSEHTLYLKMEASNLNKVIATSQIAVVRVFVSPYLYDQTVQWEIGQSLYSNSASQISQIHTHHLSTWKSFYGIILSAPSSRITSPFISPFSTIACTRWAYSCG